MLKVNSKNNRTASSLLALNKEVLAGSTSHYLQKYYSKIIPRTVNLYGWLCLPEALISCLFWEQETGSIFFNSLCNLSDNDGDALCQAWIGLQNFICINRTGKNELISLHKVDILWFVTKFENVASGESIA